AARFAVTGPGWSGSLPDGVETIAAPTPFVWIIGRTQTNGTADYAAVHELQDGMTIAPLSGRVAGPAAVDPSVGLETGPMEQLHALSGREYFTLASELLALHPPHPTDFSMVARMRRIGSDVDEVPAAAQALMRDALPRLAPVFNGWQMNTSSMGVYGN